MGKVLQIGAGGVGTVVAHKLASLPEIFSEVTLASRTKSKCDIVAKEVEKNTGHKIKTAQVDADDVDQLIKLINEVKPDLVVNVALPYQDLSLIHI